MKPHLVTAFGFAQRERHPGSSALSLLSCPCIHNWKEIMKIQTMEQIMIQLRRNLQVHERRKQKTGCCIGLKRCVVVMVSITIEKPERHDLLSL